MKQVFFVTQVLFLSLVFACSDGSPIVASQRSGNLDELTFRSADIAHNSLNESAERKTGGRCRLVRNCYNWIRLSSCVNTELTSEDYKMTDGKIATGVAHEAPADPGKALAAAPKIPAMWNGLAPLARNEWICWVASVRNRKPGKTISSGHARNRSRERFICMTSFLMSYLHGTIDEKEGLNQSASDCEQILCVKIYAS